jgi:hypothetical protein
MQTNISPVAVFPSEANVLYIRSITLGPPPAYYYELQNVTVVEKTREVPNPAYVPASVDADGSDVPAQGEPTIVETYEENVVTVLKNGNVNMTEEQWDNWAAGPETEDEPYQLDCISANLGLTHG